MRAMLMPMALTPKMIAIVVIGILDVLRNKLH